MSGEKFNVTTPESREKKEKLKVYAVVCTLIAVILVGSIAFSDNKSKLNVAPSFKGVGPVDANEQRDEIFESRLNALDKADSEIKGQLRQIKELLENKQGVDERKFEEFKEKTKNDLDSRLDEMKSTYIAPPLDERISEVEQGQETGQDTTENGGNVPPPPAISRQEIESGIEYSASPFKKKPIVRESNGTNSQIISVEDVQHQTSTRITNEEVPVQKKLVKNRMAGFLPATSAIPITLYTSLDAIASASAQANPEPVHFKFTDNAFLPDNARYRLSNCRGVAVGYGDLSTTRAKLKASRIVCIDVLEDRILEAEINGFITDSDSVLGLRGEVNNREGQIAGKAFAAAFVEGAANLVAASNQTTTTVGGAALQTINGTQALRGGIAAGTGRAAEMLAQRYIEQMEAISPTIDIGMARKAVLHISEGTSLEWKQYSNAYVEEIKPVTSDAR